MSASVPRLQWLPPLTEFTWLQGTPSDLTTTTSNDNLILCLLLQVNCPGCHTHALDVVQQINDKADDEFHVWILSTAFEDFEYNTEAHTVKLLVEGERVGVPRQQLGAKVPLHQRIPPRVPVAYDMVVDKAAARPELLDLAMQATRITTRQQAQAMHPDIPSMVLEQALEQLTIEATLPPKIAWGFYAVAASGTPTWMAHTRQGKIVDRFLGPTTPTRIRQWMDQCRTHYHHQQQQQQHQRDNDPSATTTATTIG